MPCLIPGCSNQAPYYLGIRLRRPADHRPAGTAIWAPDCDAYLCATHAAMGYTIDIRLTLNNTRTITTIVSAGGQVETKTSPIQHLP